MWLCGMWLCWVLKIDSIDYVNIGYIQCYNCCLEYVVNCMYWLLECEHNGTRTHVSTCNVMITSLILIYN